MVLSFTLAVAVLAGCSKSQQSYQDTQQGSTQSVQQESQQNTISNKAETEAVEKNDQTTVGYEDNKDKDLEELAALTAFPVYVGLPDVGVVETKEDFLNLGAETVFTEELLKSIEMADIEDFQPSMAGFSISDGKTANINFGVVDGILAINGINY